VVPLRGETLAFVSDAWAATIGGAPMAMATAVADAIAAAHLRSPGPERLERGSAVTRLSSGGARGSLSGAAPPARIARMEPPEIGTLANRLEAELRAIGTDERATSERGLPQERPRIPWRRVSRLVGASRSSPGRSRWPTTTRSRSLRNSGSLRSSSAGRPPSRSCLGARRSLGRSTCHSSSGAFANRGPGRWSTGWPGTWRAQSSGACRQGGQVTRRAAASTVRCSPRATMSRSRLMASHTST
jgi:hypothetical protein